MVTPDLSNRSLAPKYCASDKSYQLALLLTSLVDTAEPRGPDPQQLGNKHFGPRLCCPFPVVRLRSDLLPKGPATRTYFGVRPGSPPSPCQLNSGLCSPSTPPVTLSVEHGGFASRYTTLPSQLITDVCAPPHPLSDHGFLHPATPPVS